jgi:hypothetical protein
MDNFRRVSLVEQEVLTFQIMRNCLTDHRSTLQVLHTFVLFKFNRSKIFSSLLFCLFAIIRAVWGYDV